MRKPLMKRLLAFLTAVCFAWAVPVYAAQPETDDFTLSDSDKTQIAGSLITDIMDLIMEQYVGSDVTPEELYEAALRGMSVILDDYSEYLDDDELSDLTGSLSGKLTGIGVVLRQNDDRQAEVVRVLPDSPAREAGLKRGDVIQTVNGKAVAGYTINEIVALITDPEVKKATLQVKRGAVSMTFHMYKREIHTTVYADRMENILGPQTRADAFRYICITSISGTTADDLREIITSLKKEGVTGIVIDMRGNGGGYLETAVDICSQIVPKGPVVHTVDSKGSQNTTYSALAKSPFEKMVVLVDGNTASAAELITAALQDAKAAVVIGETTYGKGVIQTLFPLITGGGFKLTTEEYLRRSGEKINKIGVTPDIAIEMNAVDYETSTDTALIKALEVLSASK